MNNSPSILSVQVLKSLSFSDVNVCVGKQGLKIENSKPEPLKVMISGAPASGKGTQSELIVQEVSRNYVFVS